jgi:hypothetical protein
MPKRKKRSGHTSIFGAEAQKVDNNVYCSLQESKLSNLFFKQVELTYGKGHEAFGAACMPNSQNIWI